jgi:hypothetical protein
MFLPWSTFAGMGLRPTGLSKMTISLFEIATAERLVSSGQLAKLPALSRLKTWRLSMAEARKGVDRLADFKRNPIYQRRVVVFYDFLGWQNHIDEAGGAPANLGLLRRMILRHKRMLGVKTDLEIRSSTFSDNVVITQAAGEKTQMLMQHLANVQLGSALVGFLVRGGITVGNVVHDNEVVFGPGLNRAYHLESKIAKYPTACS